MVRKESANLIHGGVAVLSLGWVLWIPAYAGMTGYACGMRPESTSSQVIVQVPPAWVGFFNLLEFPCTIPFFDRLLSHYGTFHRFMTLVPDQGMNAISFCESIHKVMLVLPDSLKEV